MREAIKRVPTIGRLIGTQWWQAYRFGVTLRTERRENSHFTGFLRLPTQYSLLVGPVLDFLRHRKSPAPLRIFSIGCSIGAEAFTVASVLTSECPNLGFHIDAFDRNEGVIDRARNALFDPISEIFTNRKLTDEFVAKTFDEEPGGYRVTSEIRRRVRFHVIDIDDKPRMDKFGKADLIFAQNFLFHLEPSASEAAFDTIHGLMANHSILYVDGMDIPQRVRLTRKYKLQPLEKDVEKIHDEARVARAAGYPYHYWGLEPLSTRHRDWIRRYSTIYMKSAGVRKHIH